MFIGKYNKSVVLTYMGVCFAVLGIFLANNKDIANALICLIISGICDLFDGAVARSMKRDREDILYGIQLDSLADMVGFIFLPICILINTSTNGLIDLFICSFYAIAGLTRLSYFNVNAIQKENEPIKFYTGLPVTFVAIIIPLLYLVFKFTSLFQVIYSFFILTISFLFITKIKIPKPTGKAYKFFMVIAVIVIILLRSL